MENLINVDPNILHTDEMRQLLPDEMIKLLETDTSQSGYALSHISFIYFLNY